MTESLEHQKGLKQESAQSESSDNLLIGKESKQELAHIYAERATRIGKLIEGGVKYVFDESNPNPRLEVTDKQIKDAEEEMWFEKNKGAIQRLESELREFFGTLPPLESGSYLQSLVVKLEHPNQIFVDVTLGREYPRRGNYHIIEDRQKILDYVKKLTGVTNVKINYIDGTPINAGYLESFWIIAEGDERFLP